MKTKTILFLAIAITATLVTQSIFADAVNELVLTENSSTSLTATYNGSTVAVNLIGPDNWSIRFPDSIAFNDVLVGWVEPENSSFANVCSFVSEVSSVFVFSDISTVVTPVANGTTVDNVGFDFTNGISINATFHDNAATAEVPDTGSTLGLLFLSLIVLVGASRLRCIRLA